MDKRELKRKLVIGLGWSAGMAVVAGALAAVANLVVSHKQGYLQDGGPLAFGGTLMVVLSTALFVFPVALFFFWLRTILFYRKKNRLNTENEDK